MTTTPCQQPPTTVEIDSGAGVPVTVDLGTANEYGDFDEAAYEGNLYLTINGRLYGSLYIRHDADAGHPTITLGQYDPAAQQWEPRNEIGPEASDDATPVVTATDAAVNR
ncbi:MULTISPECIES: hypothetical protein [Mycolicibacterium]|uniref:Uncharacterized protein n=2 Tax=Mycolicibacterium TaxID=1866885 RepID=A0AAW5SII7_MYCNV|nr:MULTISPECIES: hypothetical protein [Mycolicibacterium]EHB45827.1 hypothetical protein MycrhDRAFT_6305 [Mycolicibacterium rhodesiae JS60]MCV7022882.1 hypothetical protein [Mycolicibacterium novocastrense]MDG5486581.1 hypothetical protein [Mycolicibacterium gadium]GAT12968.1 putative uncharacterized protein [Mycolicibacterium novocastrense]